MNNLLNSRRRRIGAIVIVIVVAVAALMAILAIGGIAQQNTSNTYRGDVANQFQVIITPEATSTEEVIPTLAPIIDPPLVDTPMMTPTPTLQGIITPDIALDAMPLRECGGCMNILLLGLDQRPSENPNMNRSDTMIILTLNTTTHTAGMLSIPRDLLVPMPNSNSLDRINTAIAYGGPAYAMRTVEYNFGISIQHYVRVNFNAVSTLVDLVGGVDVYVDQDINDPTYPDMNYGYDPFVISKGMHHMDGATALKYARTRHQTSDFYRMRRQQQIIMALRDRVLSTDAIARLLPNAPQILSTLSSSILTDLSPSEIVQLIMLAKDLPPDNITRITVDETAAQPWTTPNGAQILLPNRNRISQLTAELYHEAIPTLAVAEGISATERIAIQNATPNRGVAINAQTYLRSLGYRIVDVRDAIEDYPMSLIYDSHGPSTFTQQLATTLGLPPSTITTTLPAAPMDQVDVLVILGADYRQGQ